MQLSGILLNMGQGSAQGSSSFSLIFMGAMILVSVSYTHLTLPTNREV